MDPLSIVIIAILLGLYVAWNIGANDVANSMATAVGARALTYRQAILVAAILNFVGAVFIGSHVTETVRKGIVSIGFINDPQDLLIGFLCALLSAGLWITLSTWKSLPVSTTHSIIGALIGFGLIAGGWEVIKWRKVFEVFLSWIISPLFAGALSFTIFRVIVRSILLSPRRKKAVSYFTPFLIIFTVTVIFFSLIFKTPLGKKLSGRMWIIPVLGGTTAFLLWNWVRRFVKGRGRVEAVFKRLQIFTSCYMALSHGANDVANAIGPVASIYSILKFGISGAQVPVPVWLLAVGGVGIALGISTWGYRVMQTIGYRITRLSHTRGFTIDFSAATSILLASKLGMPVSTTHAVVGAVAGIGLARGLEAVDFRVLKQIVVSWFLTLPLTILSTIFFYKIAKVMFS
ncbi:MAG TPA: inorganic phosphate transporter [bacterium]|nr:inorganic phosphate transporter [bacterium]HEX67950.1 inorganic phosphate transporter [bacterium]